MSHASFKPLKPSGYFMYHQVFKAKNSTFAHRVHTCSVKIREQIAIISPNSVNWLVSQLNGMSTARYGLNICSFPSLSVQWDAFPGHKF